MIEIIQAIIVILLITVTSYFPEKYLLMLKKNKNIKSIGLVDKLTIGMVAQLFFLLIVSFFSVFNEKIVFFYFLLLVFHNIFFFVKENKSFKKIINLQNLFLFFVIFLISIYLLNNFYVGWDGQNYWLHKTLIILENDSIEKLKNSTRPEYPYLGSFIWYFFTKFSFLNDNELFGRIFYVYLFSLSLMSLADIATKDLIKNLIFFTFLILILFKNNLFNGYQEILIFSFFILIFKYSFLIYENKKNFNNYYLFVIFLCSVLIAWIKSEGLIFSLIFLFNLFIYYRDSKEIKFSIIVVVTMIILSRFIYLNSIDVLSLFQSGNYENFEINKINEFLAIERFSLIFKYFIIGMFQNPLLLIGLISLFIMRKNKNLEFFNNYSTFIILSLFFIFLAYLFSSIPLEFHLKNSINRLFFQISGIGIISLIAFYRKLIK